MRKFPAFVNDVSGLSLTEEQYTSFKVIGEKLKDWNQKFNLTAIDDEEDIWIKHFLDSISCWKVMQNTPIRKVIDVGTGAGFPGIPLKVMFPAVQLSLLESIAKKVRYLEHIVESLELQQVSLVNERAEDAGQMAEHREQYDWAVARAVARLPILAEYLLPFVRIGGFMLAQKGGSGPAEVQASAKALEILGGELHTIQKVALPGVVEERTLIVIRKVTATPEKYPRRAGMPAKRPLGA